MKEKITRCAKEIFELAEEGQLDELTEEELEYLYKHLHVFDHGGRTLK